MSDIDPRVVEQVAKAFHNSYEMFAPCVGWQSQEQQEKSYG